MKTKQQQFNHPDYQIEQRVFVPIPTRFIGEPRYGTVKAVETFKNGWKEVTVLFDDGKTETHAGGYALQIAEDMDNDQLEFDIETDDFHCPKCQSPDVDYVGGDNVVSVSSSELSHVEFYECANCGHRFSAASGDAETEAT